MGKTHLGLLAGSVIALAGCDYSPVQIHEEDELKDVMAQIQGLRTRIKNDSKMDGTLVPYSHQYDQYIPEIKKCADEYKSCSKSKWGDRCNVNSAVCSTVPHRKGKNECRDLMFNAGMQCIDNVGRKIAIECGKIEAECLEDELSSSRKP